MDFLRTAPVAPPFDPDSTPERIRERALYAAVANRNGIVAWWQDCCWWLTSLTARMLSQLLGLSRLTARWADASEAASRVERAMREPGR